MTTTSTTAPTTTAAPQVGSRAWLLNAAARLEAEGNHTLAAEARAEAATADAPRPVPPAPVVLCDSCHRPVSKRQADRYADLGVDWALCTRPGCQ